MLALYDSGDGERRRTATPSHTERFNAGVRDGLSEIEETVHAGFAWSRGGTATMHLTHDRGEIVKLPVTFDEEV